MWPHVERAVAFIDTLRHERMTPEYRTPEKRAYFGMVPQSISHEGYSAKPMHSYWDDFFVLTGLDDAVYVADALGRTADRARFAAIRDEFRARPAGVAERHDGDARHRLPSRLRGAGRLRRHLHHRRRQPHGRAGALLPRQALENTFERYYRQSVRARLDGAEWDGYTPYEWRTVGTFVRLGWKARAHEAIGLFFAPPPAGGVEPVGRGRLPRRDVAAVHRRHAAHLGGLGLHPLASLDLFAYEHGRARW